MSSALSKIWQSWSRKLHLMPTTHPSADMPLKQSSITPGKADVQGRQVSQSSLQALPTELLHLIRDLLPPSSIAALAITCPQMLDTIGKAWMPLDKQSKIELLRHYEKSMPGHYLCQVCAKFHFLRDIRGKLATGRNCAKERPWELKSADHVHEWSYGQGQVSFTDVQLVMNRHRHGEEYGLPPSALWDIRRGSEDGVSGVHHHQVREARIVNHELIFATTHRFFLQSPCCARNPKRIELLKREIRRSGIIVCPHLAYTRTGNSNVESNNRFGKLTSYHVSGHDLSNTDGLCARVGEWYCLCCALDYVVSINYTALDGWEIVLKGFQNLGSGRLPRDSKWRSCCDSRFHKQRHLGIIECWEPRSIREAFESVPATALTARQWNANCEYRWMHDTNAYLYVKLFMSVITRYRQYFHAIEYCGESYHDAYHHKSSYGPKPNKRGIPKAAGKHNIRQCCCPDWSFLRTVTELVKGRLFS